MFDLKQLEEQVINFKYDKMETKSLKQSIAIPEGYEAINVQNINGSIVYELVEVKKSMKQIIDEYKKRIDFCYYISGSSKAYYICGTDLTHNSQKNALPTTEKCEQFIALMQLVMNCWIINDCRELEKSEINCTINKSLDKEEIHISSNRNLKGVLNFKNYEIGKQFYNEFKELIETAKPLL